MSSPEDILKDAVANVTAHDVKTSSSIPGGAEEILEAVSKNLATAAAPPKNDEETRNPKKKGDEDEDDPIFQRLAATATSLPKKKEYHSTTTSPPPTSSSETKETRDDVVGGELDSSRERRKRMRSSRNRDGDAGDDRRRRRRSRDRGNSRGSDDYNRGGRRRRSRSPDRGGGGRHHRQQSHRRSRDGRRRRNGSPHSDTSSSAGGKGRPRAGSRNRQQQATTTSAPSRVKVPPLVISQLQTKTRKEDVERFFNDRLGCPVRTVEIVKDGVTGRCKGSAYVELLKEEDIPNAVARSGGSFVWPDGSEGFPVLIKLVATDDVGSGNSTSGNVSTTMNFESGGGMSSGPSSRVANEMELKRRKESVVRIEILDRESRVAKVTLRNDLTQFELPLIVPMTLKGEVMVSSWLRVTAAPTLPYPEVAEKLTAAMASGKHGPHLNLHHFLEKSYSLLEMANTEAAAKALSSLMGGDAYLPELVVDPIAEHAAMISRGRTAPSPIPTRRLCVFPCFDPRQENEPGWWNEIENDIAEECNNSFGPVMVCKVDRFNYEGRVYLVFRSVEDAEKAARGLMGRFFGGKQLQVEFEM